jgi:PAS domain S-box-containing protein
MAGKSSTNLEEPFPDLKPSEEVTNNETIHIENFFEVSLDLMVIRDESYKILKVNNAWERVLGYNVEELEGQPMLSFIHPDDLEASQAMMHNIAAVGETRHFINRYRCKDGGYRDLEWRARQAGRLVYGVARDVTDRLALEAELARGRAEALAANNAKSAFLANMSHEIRTPLNGVIGIAAVLARTELSARQRELVELILTSGATLERIVSDVLDFSKIEAGRLDIQAAPFDLRAEMEGLLGGFRVQAQEKGLAFAVELGARARGEHLGDAVRIKQILGNLVSNALKFTEAGWVRVAIDILDTADEAAPELVLEVKDSGIGFDEAFAPELFQRFRQADGSITRRFGGTGLGLSICGALVQMMGGDIRAVSRPGQGSRFTVRLPLARPRRDRRDAQARETSAAADFQAWTGASGRRLQILLAEDHDINQRVIELMLQPLGVALTTVEDGAQAVSACQARGFDVVLMDMQMPVMDGLAATRAIRAHEQERPGRPRTPIIMLSANAMRQHGEEAKAAGADLHLAKPVTPARLLQALSDVVGGGVATAA